MDDAEIWYLSSGDMRCLCAVCPKASQSYQRLKVSGVKHEYISRKDGKPK
jgi:hypothetical protein